MSIFSKLFGGNSGDSKAGAVIGDPVAYEGYLIEATPMPADSQWRLAGVIVKETDGGRLERTFVRADLFASREEAGSFAVRKGQQIIDEQGDRLFADGSGTGRA